VRTSIHLALLVLLALPASADPAQSPDDARIDGGMTSYDGADDDVDGPSAEGPLASELREAMRRYFHNGLRRELGLTDEQVQAIVPMVERIEQTKTETSRQRRETVRLLRHGLRTGAADGRLQELLDRWHRIEREQQDLERTILAEIDAQLTARQRVQLRFFIETFRRQIARRVQELRQGAGPGAGERPRRRP